MNAVCTCIMNQLSPCFAHYHRKHLLRNRYNYQSHEKVCRWACKELHMIKVQTLHAFLTCFGAFPSRGPVAKSFIETCCHKNEVVFPFNPKFALQRCYDAKKIYGFHHLHQISSKTNLCVNQIQKPQIQLNNSFSNLLQKFKETHGSLKDNDHPWHKYSLASD
jgi:hypothetical protein